MNTIVLGIQNIQWIQIDLMILILLITENLYFFRV